MIPYQHNIPMPILRFSLQATINRSLMVTQMDRARKRLGNRSGAYLRTVARSRLRQRRRRSRPGESPSSHNRALRNSILFDYDANTGDVIVGPTTYRNRKIAGVTGAQALEFGGPFVDSKGRRGYMRARPYMLPALEKSIPRIRSFIADFFDRT